MPNDSKAGEPEGRDAPPSNKWRKKPVVIEAVQIPTDYAASNGGAFWEGDLPRFIEYGRLAGTPVLPMPEDIVIQTLEHKAGEGFHASPGDWLIRGVKGEVYACKPDIFAATYEPIGGSSQAGSAPAGKWFVGTRGTGSGYEWMVTGPEGQLRLSNEQDARLVCAFLNAGAVKLPVGVGSAGSPESKMDVRCALARMRLKHAREAYLDHDKAPPVVDIRGLAGSLEDLLGYLGASPSSGEPPDVDRLRRDFERLYQRALTANADWVTGRRESPAAAEELATAACRADDAVHEVFEQALGGSSGEGREPK